MIDEVNSELADSENDDESDIRDLYNQVDSIYNEV
jgi:uncharacterized protein YpuA (DUF1002 family)